MAIEKESPEERAKRYSRRRYALAVISLILGLSFLLLMAFYLTRPMRDLASDLAHNYYLQVAIYYTGFCLLFFLISLPLDFYSGYILEHSFGLSNQGLVDWVKEELKGGGLAFALTLPLVEVIYFLLRNLPQYWWVLAGIFLTFFSIVMVRLGPTWILPLFYKSTPLEDKALREALIPLATGAGVTLEGVYKINLSKDTKKANAMLAGLGKTRRVILGDTLLEKFSTEEIQAVFAHELGHHVYRHIWKMLLVGSLGGFAGLALCNIILQWLVKVFHFYYLYDVATFPFIVLVLSCFALILLPLENLYSRYLKGRCDLYALESTRNPQAFISAMNKLSEQNLADKEPGTIIEYLFFDHPPISKRIKMARDWLARKGADSESTQGL